MTKLMPATHLNLTVASHSHFKSTVYDNKFIPTNPALARILVSACRELSSTNELSPTSTVFVSPAVRELGMGTHPADEQKLIV